MEGKILLDMDDTLYDFLGNITDLYRRLYPEEPFVAPEDMYDNHFSKVYREQIGHMAEERMEELFHMPELYRNLRPLPGAVEAVHEMLDEGLDVRVCTAPLRDYRHCVHEKYESLDEHFGKNLTDHLVLARDKTAIKGDILVDDRPRISGRYEPEWNHVLFDQPFNRHVDLPRIQSWSEWKSILKR
ncbi:MAG: 5' nucleotidase, NT5C type [Candidatus Woesearchaeota archaeon]